MRGIWGSSSRDVYIVGHSDLASGQMWHYNGKGWIPVHLHASYGGPIEGAFSFGSIYGFSEKEIFAVGGRYEYDFGEWIRNPLIVRFDGSSWHIDDISHLGEDISPLSCVWGLSPTQIWAGGGYSGDGPKGVILYYDGLDWRKDSLSALVPEQLAITDFGGSSINDIYAVGVQYRASEISDMKYLLKRQPSGLWIPVDSLQTGLQRFGTRLWTSPSGKLYSASNNGVFLRKNETWERMGSIDSGWPSKLFGSGDRNIFYLSSHGLYHYNGIDWSLNQDAIFTKWGEWFYDAGWTDGNQAFITARIWDFPQRTIILHGR